MIYYTVSIVWHYYYYSVTVGGLVRTSYNGTVCNVIEGYEAGTKVRFFSPV
jgi:hypothetical protein